MHLYLHIKTALKFPESQSLCEHKCLSDFVFFFSFFRRGFRDALFLFCIYSSCIFFRIHFCHLWVRLWNSACFFSCLLCLDIWDVCNSIPADYELRHFIFPPRPLFPVAFIWLRAETWKYLQSSHIMSYGNNMNANIKRN